VKSVEPDILEYAQSTRVRKRNRMRILLIANPLVGIRKEKRAVLDRVTAELRKRGHSVDITYILKTGAGRNYSSRAALEGYGAVYAAGGDGTVNEVASGLIGKPVPLGIIPLGTGNGLARGLGIPLDPDRVIRILLRNRVTTIDAGKIADRFFFATAGIGYDAYIAHDFNRSRRVRTSASLYFLSAVKNYFLRRSERVTLKFDGHETRRALFGLTICNTPQYGSGATIAPQADPRSGKLVAVLIPKLSPLKALPAIKKLFDGSVTEIKEIEYVTFKKLKIIRKSPGIFHFDGETRTGDKTLNVQVKPASLKIIVP